METPGPLSPRGHCCKHREDSQVARRGAGASFLNRSDGEVSVVLYRDRSVDTRVYIYIYTERKMNERKKKEKKRKDKKIHIITILYIYTCEM